MEELLSVDDVARAFGVTPVTVRDLLRRGDLRGVRPKATKVVVPDEKRRCDAAHLPADPIAEAPQGGRTSTHGPSLRTEASQRARPRTTSSTS